MQDGNPTAIIGSFPAYSFGLQEDNLYPILIRLFFLSLGFCPFTPQWTPFPYHSMMAWSRDFDSTPCKAFGIDLYALPRN